MSQVDPLKWELARAVTALAATRQAWQDCREECTHMRQELAEARAALREIDSTTVPSGFLRVWRERHAAAVEAAREQC